MWLCSAPSNVALIKYMGKFDKNIPTNASLSYTLNDFVTEVSLEVTNTDDRFEGLDLNLNQQSIERFLLHLKMIKQRYNCAENFIVKSKNNFPHSAGIASSASSFAALTICACNAIAEIQAIPMPSIQDMSAISREGSGSSCRSFFTPWCVWKDEIAVAADIQIANLQHDLVLIDASDKKIRSSVAHKLIRTSLLFEGREKRANIRLEKLMLALNCLEWGAAYQICWEEFSDMHALFETSFPHFGYMQEKTIYYLRKIRNFWKANNDGPLTTIDAGPNIHLLWRGDQTEVRKKFCDIVMNGCDLLNINNTMDKI